MPLTATAKKQPQAESRLLTEWFEPTPHLEFSFGDIATYKSLHAQALHLVSMVDELGSARDPEVLTLRYHGKPLGVTSFLVETNARRPAPRRKFARIDLVITHPVFRGMGVGRLLMLLVVAFLLERNGDELYSISCLAAHDAVAHVLEDIQFTERPPPPRPFEEVTYKHEHLRLGEDEGGIDLAAYQQDIHRMSEHNVRMVNFRLRQMMSATMRW